MRNKPLSLVRHFSLLSFWLVLGTALFAQIPEKPNPPKLVNDFAEVLTVEEEQMLEDKLVQYEQGSSTQIAVVTVPSLNGYAVEKYSYELAKKWGIGQKGKNNGVLVLMALSDKKIRIEVGYGLEAVIPDVIAKRIIRETMKPAFRSGEFFRGIDDATDLLMEAASSEFPSKEAEKSANKKKVKKKQSTTSIIGQVLFVLFLVWVFRKNPWLLWLLLSSSRNSGGGNWKNFSGGSGGFGGFGGGSFGGGGASGDW